MSELFVRRDQVPDHPQMGRCVLKVALLLSACVCLATAAGCGSSIYGEKFDKRLAELELSSPFAVLRDPTDELPINFRIPSVLTAAYDRNSSHPADDNKRIHADRVAPLFMMDFPGLRVMYEGEATGRRLERFPVYCYLGEGETDSVKGKFPYDLWLARVKKALPDTKPWQAIDVPTPQGKKLSWKRLVAKGKQEFNIVDSNQRLYQTIEGNFELWVYETPQWIAVLGWRAPVEAAATVHLEDLAKLTAGTATLNPAAAAMAAKDKPGKAKPGDNGQAPAPAK